MKKDQVDLRTLSYGFRTPKLQTESLRFLSRHSPSMLSEIRWRSRDTGHSLFPSDLNATGHQKDVQDRLAKDSCDERRSPTFGFTICAPRMQLGSVPAASRTNG